jgi:hypothetical protein
MPQVYDENQFGRPCVRKQYGQFCQTYTDDRNLRFEQYQPIAKIAVHTIVITTLADLTLLPIENSPQVLCKPIGAPAFATQIEEALDTRLQPGSAHDIYRSAHGIDELAGGGSSACSDRPWFQHRSPAAPEFLEISTASQ